MLEVSKYTRVSFEGVSGLCQFQVDPAKLFGEVVISFTASCPKETSPSPSKLQGYRPLILEILKYRTSKI